MDKYDERSAQIIAGLGINVTGPHDWKGEPQASKYSVDRKALYALKDSIVAALREAVQEAISKEYEGDCSNVSMIEHKAYQRGHYDGLEEAAKIVLENHEHHKHCNCEAVAEQIRVLKGIQ